MRLDDDHAVGRLVGTERTGEGVPPSHVVSSGRGCPAVSDVFVNVIRVRPTA